MHAFEHFQGIPELAVPDNCQDRCEQGAPLRSGSESDLLQLRATLRLRRFCPRVRASRATRPRWKAPCKWRSVGSWRRCVIASSSRWKNSTWRFASCCGKLNHRPFRKKDGTRASVWEAIDKPALKPLPMEPFDLSEWCRARVNIDYHVAFDANFYSVPYNLVHEVVEIRSTPTTVEILHKGTRVASHLRSRERNKAVTIDEHRPKSHREHLEWPPSRMVHWAEPSVRTRRDCSSGSWPTSRIRRSGYRGCLGIIRLAGKYSPQRVEAACRACAAHRRVPLQEHRIDPENIAGSGASGKCAATSVHAAA